MPEKTMTVAAPIRAIKGFNSDLTCEPAGVTFQYAFGETYKHDGLVKACRSGFHAIEGHPLEVLGYYAPATSRYAVVELSGAVDRDNADSKVAAEILKVGDEIRLAELAAEAVKWVIDRATPEGAASATGYQGAASATGDQGAASATGFYGKVRGKDGSALFLVYRRDDYSAQRGEILHVWAGIVGKDGIKADTWYALDENGRPQEVTE